MIYHKEQQAQWAQYKIKYQAQLKENNKMSNNIYNILGKLKGITDNAALTPDTEATTVYESVDARGSITEAVKSLEAKYQTFKEAKAKPDFLDVDKDGDKKEPMKQAVKEKKAEPFSSDDYDEYGVRHSSSFNQPPKKAVKDKNNAKGAFKDMFGGDAKDLTSKLKIKEGAGPYTLDDPKHPKFKANYEKFKKSNPDCKLADFVAAMKKKEKNLSEAAYDEPAEIDADAVAKRKRLQALKDKQEDERAERGSEKTNTPIRKVAGNAYGGAAQKDDVSDLDESVQFGDTVKNSKAEMKKAKLAKIKEGRVMEETDYFYEQVAKALCEKNPNLNTADSEFADAVRKEMVAQGIQPNRARNILLMDEDFLGDVATSYSHYSKEVAECGAPMNSHLGGVSELDEIAALAGLPAPMAEADVQQEIGLERSSLEELDESSINEAASRKDFRMVADLIKNISDEAKRKELAQHHADIFKQQNPRFSHDKFYAAAGVVEGNAFTGKLADTPAGETFSLGDKTFTDTSAIEEADMAEGNEFSGALAAAKASGAKEFEVAGKRYTVKEDINVNITANGQEDALNLFRKLAGMDEVTAQPAIQAVGVTELPQDAESAIAQGVVEPCDGAIEVVDAVDEERDPEYVNSPREQTAGIDAAIPSGNDLHATKRAYKIAQPGDNPMAVAEAKDTSWSKYTSLLKGLTK
jgi:hypothetical protein